MIHFVCPSCETELEIEDSGAGKHGNCPACGAAIHAPQSSAATATVPPAGGVQITKSVFGRHHVSYKCPRCGDDLRSPLADAGKPDTCPNCNARFVVPGAENLQRMTAEKEADARRKREEAEQRRETKLREQQEKAEARAREREVEAAAREQRRQDQLNEQKERAAARAREMEVQAIAQQERERKMVENRKCSSCGAQLLNGDDQFCDACKTSASPTKRPDRRAVVGVVLVAIAFLVPLPVGYSWFRNSGLRSKLDACESSGVIHANVTYEGLISTEGVVFDVLDGGSPSARRIDPVHLLLQFAGRLDMYSIERVVLARNGRHVFYISAADLRPLADSYAGGGRVWAFNNVPARVRTMSGGRPYNEWSGGWLGVLQKQSEDVNDFIREWTGY